MEFAKLITAGHKIKTSLPYTEETYNAAPGKCCRLVVYSLTN